MVAPCSRAKVCSRVWKTESCVARVEVCVLRRVAPCVAYEVLRVLCALKALRPTPRRVDILRSVGCFVVRGGSEAGLARYLM